MSGKAGKSLLLPHRFWEQISPICMTSHTLDLNLKQSPRQFHKRWNLEFFKEGEIKHHPCLGKSTKADSTWVYEHGNDDLCMLQGGRNIFIFLCNYLYAFLRDRNSWALGQRQGKKNQEDSKTIPQFPLKCGMQEPAGKETNRGIMHREAQAWLSIWLSLSKKHWERTWEEKGQVSYAEIHSGKTQL